MRACIPNMQQLVVAACSEQVVPNGQSSPPDCTLSASVKENWTLFRLHSWNSVHFRLHSEANYSFPFHPGFVNRTSCGITEQLSKCSGQEKQGTTLNCLAQNCLLVGILEGKPISTPKTCISQELRLLQTESCSKERVVKLPTPKVHFPREEVSQEPDRVLFKGVGRRQLSKAAGRVVGAATKASGMPRSHLGTSSSTRSAANSAALCLAPRPAAAAAPCWHAAAGSRCSTSSKLGRCVGACWNVGRCL